MNIASILRPRVLVAFAVALILSVSAYGFAAANTGDLSAAGDGVKAISGYNITDVTYVLNATDPSKIDSVSFTADPIDPATGAATHVQAQLITSGQWFAGALSGSTWTVDVTGATVPITATAVNNLRVVAAQ